MGGSPRIPFRNTAASMAILLALFACGTIGDTAAIREASQYAVDCQPDKALAILDRAQQAGGLSAYIAELEKIVVKTEKYWVEYKDGKRILDMHSGNSAYILGYGNEEVIEAMNEQIRSVAFVRGNRGGTAEICQEMAKLVCETGGFDVMSWAVTGSSAVEAAIAMNDTYWKRQKYHWFPQYL